MNTKALIAEFIGTFALVFIGAGAAASGDAGLVGVALAFASVVVGFAYAYGHISGAHLNPVVTLAVLVCRKVKVNDAIGYWVVQFLAGIVAALALRALLPGADPDAVLGLGATVLSPGVTPAEGVVIEAMLTFFLVNTILNAAVSGKAGSLAGLAIGATLVFCILMGGPLTGASLNPARTLGPALLTGTMSQFWIYLVGPCLGALAAAGLYRGVLEKG